MLQLSSDASVSEVSGNGSGAQRAQQAAASKHAEVLAGELPCWAGRYVGTYNCDSNVNSKKTRCV